VRRFPGVVGVTLVLLLAVACSGDDGDGSGEAEAAPSTTAAPAPTSLYDLEVGDCFSGLDPVQDLRIRIVECARRHQAEVYGVVELQARRYPGEDVLRRRAATDCVQDFVGYTGEPVGPDTALAFTEVVPTLESFTTGDRRALCVALGRDGAPLRATIRRQGEA
jgi:hypothetical protein